MHRDPDSFSHLHSDKNRNVHLPDRVSQSIWLSVTVLIVLVAMVLTAVEPAGATLGPPYAALGNTGVPCASGSTCRLTFDTSEVPDASMTTQFQLSLQVSGGTPPYELSTAKGALPPGLSLSTAGVISGVASAPGTFIFTIIATDSAGASVMSPQFHMVVYSFSIPGWTTPRAINAMQIYGSVTYAKLEGVDAVVFGDQGGEIHVVNASNGKALPGWPRHMAGGPGAQVWSTPAVVDLGSQATVIIGSGTNTSTVGEVEAFDANGQERWVFRVGRKPGTYLGVISSPAVGDITGSGQADVVFGAWDHNLYALTPTGALVPGFPYDTQDTIWSSPALYALPGQREDDIFVGDDASGLGGCDGGFVDDFRYESGRPVLRWTHCEPQTIWSSPAVGVIDATGRAAVVVGTGYGHQPFPVGTDRFYAYYADSGADVPGWPVDTSGPSASSPAIGVLRPGALPDVVTSSYDAGNTMLAAWSGRGQKLWSDTLSGSSPFMLASPVLVPLLAKRANDILIGTGSGLFAVEGSNGHLLYNSGSTPIGSQIGCDATATPAVGHITGQGTENGWNLYVPCGASIQQYALPVVPLIAPAWPMFRRDAAHVGAE